jgi:hypothetical protein
MEHKKNIVKGYFQVSYSLDPFGPRECGEDGRTHTLPVIVEHELGSDFYDNLAARVTPFGKFECLPDF